VAVALSCAKRSTKKAFADRFDPKEQAATKELSDAVTEAVLTYLHYLAHPVLPNSTPPYRYHVPSGE
jgi:hypothetical protein